MTIQCSDKFRMPAEWEPHEATWLTWPTDPDTFPPEIITKVETTYVQMIQALREGEHVHVLVNDTPTEEKVTALIGSHINVTCHVMPTQDVWIRDYGPTFVTNGQTLGLVQWDYNAYGEKYEELKADAHIPQAMNKTLQLPYFQPNIFFEGGGIEVNGQGLGMTTDTCLLNPNRNPNLDKAQAEEILKEYLGVERCFWLQSGLPGDDTDGHIDNLARFVNERTIVCCLQENIENLARQTEGLNLEIVSLPLPENIHNKKTGPLPASYANFYIGNQVVLVPTYHGPQDEKALNLLEEYFPNRKVIPIDATHLIWGLGSLHCVTQQQPKLL